MKIRMASEDELLSTTLVTISPLITQLSSKLMTFLFKNFTFVLIYLVEHVVMIKTLKQFSKLNLISNLRINYKDNEGIVFVPSLNVRCVSKLVITSWLGQCDQFLSLWLLDLFANFESVTHMFISYFLKRKKKLTVDGFGIELLAARKSDY